MKYSNPQIDSSYRIANIGKTLYDVVLDLKPKKIIEFGVLGGYSTVAMAMALDELGRGTIKAYDLWEKYPHKNSTMRATAENIRAHGVEKYVELYYGDYESIEPEPYDLLHLDVSNTGSIVREFVEKWQEKGGRILFEGGTPYRDDVDWMVKYDKEPIVGCGVDYEVLNDAFPSVSIICKN